MAYAPQSVSLAQAGGDLDLLDALRGSRRAKTQQEMLREQSMSPVEIGSYNGIQGKFPISQGLNKIAQGLLATYMDYQARDRAQAAADAQKEEAQKYAAGFAGTPAVAGVDAVLPERGTVAGPVVDGVDPETPGAANFRIVMDKLRRDQPGQEGEDYRAAAPVFGMPGQRLEAAPGQGDTNDPGVVGRDAVAAQPGTGPTQAQRTAMMLQGMVSSNPAVNRMAAFLGTQDAEGRARQEKLDAAAQLQKDRLDAQGFQAGQQRDRITADRAIAREGRPPAHVTLEDDDGKPAMFVLNPDGTRGNRIGTVPGKEEKAATEEQSKAALYGHRMVEAEGIISKLEHIGTSSVEAARSKVPGIGNLTASADYQSLEQAKRNFITAVLRRESGASIQPSEYEMADKLYFPKVWDGPVVLKQKEDARRTAVVEMRASAGPASSRVPEVGPARDRTPPAPKPDPASGAPVASAPLPSVASANLREGQETTFGNGQVWTSKDGKPVRVK